MKTSTKRVSIISIKQVREKSIEYEQKCMKSSTDARDIFKRFLADSDREAFVVAYLSTKNYVNAIQVISVGSLSATLVHPREVFKGALTSNAASLIVCHNHPSGQTLPSEEDDNLTERLLKVGELMGIPVIDHLIVGNDDNYYSYKDMDRLK